MNTEISVETLLLQTSPSTYFEIGAQFGKDLYIKKGSEFHWQQHPEPQHSCCRPFWGAKQCLQHSHKAGLKLHMCTTQKAFNRIKQILFAKVIWINEIMEIGLELYLVHT